MAGLLVLQHLEQEEPYGIADASRDAGLDVVVHRTDLAGAPPAVDPFAGVVVMGGPMSAARDDGFPTRSAEIELLEAALQGGKPVLGVCLGAQLLAVAGGGRVFRDGPLEIGWGEVDLHAASGTDPLFGASASPLPVLHWHGETFTLPEGAVLLASSGLYPNQAFRLGENAWGLQFHVEITRSAVESFAAAFPEEAALAPGLLVDADPRPDRVSAAGRPVLDRFAALVAAAG
ncbi:MAG: type 1 glutamine amidotransferase [Acidimicrobiia bacterium]|nr:type 1 glutamine amidotransferase [Acidimicrobiia bacterium]